MYDLGIADRLRGEGLEVVEVDGWQSRGTGELYPQGFVFHHTADGPSGSAPSLNGVIYGFANSAPGPLCNVLQSREAGYADRFYVVAAGSANHAGTGGWSGIEGNNSVYGLEIEHTGVEHFPEERALLAARCAAALIRGITDSSMCCQHYEWSNWGDGSKIDVAQDVDADHWRALVADALAGRRPPEPPSEDDVKPRVVSSLENPGWGYYASDGIGLKHIPSPAALVQLQAAGLLSTDEPQAIPADGWTALVNYDDQR